VIENIAKFIEGVRRKGSRTIFGVQSPREKREETKWLTNPK